MNVLINLENTKSLTKITLILTFFLKKNIVFRNRNSFFVYLEMSNNLEVHPLDTCTCFMYNINQHMFYATLLQKISAQVTLSSLRVSL